jgi:polysaccharide biosynthesis transport protein
VNDDLRFYIGILKRRFLPFLAVSLAVGALATVIIFAISPLYRSEATILSEQATITTGPDGPDTRDNPIARAETLKQRLLSGDNVVAVAEKFQLFPERRSTMSRSALIALMRTRVTFEPKVVNQTVRSDERNAVVYTLGFDYEKPEIASTVAGELLTIFLDTNQNQQVSAATENVRFLEGESNRIFQQLGAVEIALTKFNFENQDSLPERAIFLTSQLERAESTRKDIQRDINKLNEDLRLVDIESKLRNTTLGTDGAAGGNALEVELRRLQAELAQKGAYLAPVHPDIVSLKAQIKRLQAEVQKQDEVDSATSDKKTEKANSRRLGIDAEVSSQRKASISRMIEVNKQQLEQNEKVITELERKLSLVPEVQSKQSELTRQKTGFQKQLDDIGDKLNNAQLRLQLVKQQYSERWVVVDQPVAPREPVWPKIPRLLAMGAGLAGASGAGVVGLLELLNRSIRSSSDVLRAVNRHPMVVIPYIMTKEENRRRVRKYMLALAALVLALLATLAAVHFLFMPLDELYFKLLNRAGV